MWHRIGLLLDGSPWAENALPFACVLARMAEADLILLRVIPADPRDQPPSVSRDPVLAAARAYLDGVKDRVTAPTAAYPLAPDRVFVRLDVGERITTLCDAIAATYIDLIVMTAHARTGFPWIVVGSVAISLICQTRSPVLVIPPHAKSAAYAPAPFGDPQAPILVCLDGTRAAEAILAPAVTWAQAMHRPVCLCRLVVPVQPVSRSSGTFPATDTAAAAETALVCERAEAYLRAVQSRMPGHSDGCTRRVETAETTVARGIIAAGRAPAPGLIALATHARERHINECAIGSIADRVMQESHLPLLLVHRSDREQKDTQAQDASTL